LPLKPDTAGLPTKKLKYNNNNNNNNNRNTLVVAGLPSLCTARTPIPAWQRQPGTEEGL